MKNQKAKHNWMKLLLAIILSSICLILSFNTLTIDEVDDKTKINFSIPKLNLNLFAKENKDVLFDYLTKSSEWHVFPYSGMTIAAKRSNGKMCNPIHRFGQPLDFIGIIAYNEGYFSKSYNEVPDKLGGFNVRESKYNDKNVRVKLSLSEDSRSEMKNALASKLTIESDNKRLVLNVNEVSEDMRRTKTSSFLYTTQQELEKLTSYSPSKKIDELILPSASTILSENSIFSIQQNPDFFKSTVYHISGYVNEGEKGLISTRVINRSNNKVNIQYSDYGNSPNSPEVEFVGWSDNPKQKFNFCLAVTLGGRYPTPGNAEAEFQVWFKPANNNNKERMLFSQIKTVKVWVY
jgi:hypothetical protein